MNRLGEAGARRGGVVPGGGARLGWGVAPARRVGAVAEDVSVPHRMRCAAVVGEDGAARAPGVGGHRQFRVPAVRPPAHDAVPDVRGSGVPGDGADIPRVAHGRRAAPPAYWPTCA
ncbi:hypothetical protein ACE1SV_02700 [Streptomyces sennicomposti]